MRKFKRMRRKWKAARLVTRRETNFYSRNQLLDEKEEKLRRDNNQKVEIIH